MQEVGTGVMAELKPQQPRFAVDTEIKLEVIVEMVVQLGALTDSRNPVFQEFHEWIRLVRGIDRTWGNGCWNTGHELPPEFNRAILFETR